MRKQGNNDLAALLLVRWLTLSGTEKHSIDVVEQGVFLIDIC